MAMKAFLFDMDGVIVDTQCFHTQTALQALQRFGVSSTMEEVAQYAGTKRGTTFRGIAEKRGITLPVEELMALKDKLFREAIDRASLAPIPGIPELLRALKEKQVKTAIASSSGNAFIHFVVDRLAIRPYFDALLSGAELPESKPNPAIYLLAAKTLGVSPEDCVVLEDAGLGVQAAKAAGMFCIGYRNPNSGNQDLSRADRVVERIGDISVDELL